MKVNSSRSSIPRRGAQRPKGRLLVGLGWWFALVLSVNFADIQGAEKDKKDEKQPALPRVAIISPLAITTGVTNAVRFRGSHLTNVTALRFIDADPQPSFVVRSSRPVEVPKDADAKKVGDTQIDVEIQIANGASPATNLFVVINPAGQSESQALIVLPPGRLIEEKEPNGGFTKAQALAEGETVTGAITEAADVDVFVFKGRKGQHVRLQVHAAGSGSMLDSILTLHDSKGRTLGSQDDSRAGSDAALKHQLPADGTYYVSLIDAHDKGGPGHNYLMALNFD